MVLGLKEWFSVHLKPYKFWDQQEHVQYGNTLHVLCAYCVFSQVRCNLCITITFATYKKVHFYKGSAGVNGLPGKKNNKDTLEYED